MILACFIVNFLNLFTISGFWWRLLLIIDFYDFILHSFLGCPSDLRKSHSCQDEFIGMWDEFIRWVFIRLPCLFLLSLSLSLSPAFTPWKLEGSTCLPEFLLRPFQHLFACHEKWTDHVGSYATRLWNSYWCLILDDGAALQGRLSVWYTWLCSKATSSFTKCRCVRITCDGCCFMTYIILWAVN